MSIVQSAIERTRAESSQRRLAGQDDVNLAVGHAKAASSFDLFADDPGSSRALQLCAEGHDALAAVWRGTAPAQILNHFRGIRRELLVSLREKIEAGVAPVVLVTSALPSDGKTFVAACIARTFANAPDYRVTLLDFDLMRRTATALFKAQDMPGASDCLLKRADLRSVICTTDVARVRFVPAGTPAPDNREAFIGVQIDDLLGQLRTTGHNSVHVLDAPPVLPVVETAVLASKADVVVFVVRAGVTPRHAVDEGIARLGVDARICIVVTGTTQDSLGTYHDYAGAAYEPRGQA